MPRAMKDSGIEWIGFIPAEWLCRKVKTILIANDGGIWGNDPVGEESDKVVIRSTEQTIDGKWSIDKPATRNLSSIDYSKARIEKDDLLITKSSGSDLHIGKTTLADDYFINHECYFSNFLQRIRCSGYSPKLLWYLFNSTIIRAQCVYLQNSTSGLGNINADIIGNLYIPVPPLEEQQRIADYLDGECARIDSIVEKTRASIVEYKKLKQAIITRAVTKGMRPARPMKDSSVEWLGDIPADWDCKKVKYVATISRGLFNHRPRNDERYYDGKYPFIQTGDVAQATKYITSYSQTLNELGKSVSKEFPKGTLTMTIAANVGDVAILGFDAFFPDSVVGFVPKEESLDVYLYYVFSAMKDEFIQTAIKSTQLNLNIERIKEMFIPFPPRAEQKEIAAYLDGKTAAIDSLIEKKGRLVTELERLKKSLIFEYVTGKKEAPERT